MVVVGRLKYRIINVLIVLLVFLSRVMQSSTLQNTGDGSCYRGQPNNCQCDSLCYFFNDCCEEILIKDDNLNTTKSVHPSEVLWSCNDGYFIVDKCPKNSKFPEIINSGCQNPLPSDGILHVIPAYSQQSGLLYKNLYCAVCNGDTNFTVATVTRSKCSGDVNMTNMPAETVIQLLQNNTCNLEYHIDQEFKRHCNNPLRSWCPDGTSNVELQNQCKTGPAWNVKSFNDNIFYRNKFCCECHIDSCIPVTSGSLLGFGSGLGRRAKTFEMDITYSVFLDFTKWCGSSCKSELRSVSAMIGKRRPRVGTEMSILSNVTVVVNNFTNLNVSTQNESYVNRSVSLSIMSYVNIAFSFLSMITLCILILIYSLFHELRNFGGLITLALAITLLCGQSIFIFTSLIRASGLACRIIGALIHAIYLATFFWMALFAFDLLKTFYSDLSSSRSTSHIKKIVLFSMIAYGVPCLIIIICGILDNIAPNSLISPAYGDPACWFNHIWGGVFWFVAPVSLILLFNMSACIASVCYVYRTNKVTKRARSSTTSSSTSLVLLCVRLTTLFGLFWLLQLITVFLGNSVLKEITGLFNSLQGFFIGICFLATKRVRAMALNSFSKLSTSSVVMGDRNSTNIRTSRPTSNLAA